MYRNQYYITNKFNNVNNKFEYIKFHNMYVFYNSELDITIDKDENKVFILGLVVDASNPNNSSKDIVDELSKITKKNEFFEKCQDLTGRYIIVANIENDLIIFNDTVGAKDILILKNNQDFVISSVEKLIYQVSDVKVNIENCVLNILNSHEFRMKESLWYSSHGYDERMRRVLPNHYYSILFNSYKRIPFYLKNFNNEGERIKYIKNILEGFYEATIDKYNLIQPLTGGIDSRCLLAASKKYREKIQYYIFDINSKSKMDIKVASNISKILNLNFKIIKPNRLDRKFLEIYNNENLFQRNLPKIKNIQYHYYNNRDKNIININGNAGAVYKGEFIKDNTFEKLLEFTNLECVNFVKEDLKQWYITAEEVSKTYNIKINDLFYWEQRLGIWGSKYPKEQDIAIEEVSPFNNKNLILAMLSSEEYRQRGKNNHSIIKIIEEMWYETLDFKINPISIKRKIVNIIKKVLK